MVEAPDQPRTLLRPCLACEWALQVELAPGARVGEADGGMNGEVLLPCATERGKGGGGARVVAGPSWVRLLAPRSPAAGHPVNFHA